MVEDHQQHGPNIISFQQVAQLQSWLVAATHEEWPDTANWYRVVKILHTMFRDGRLIEECTGQMLVLIPNGNRDFIGIGIVEVL